jgi:lipoate-protein ligase A
MGRGWGGGACVYMDREELTISFVTDKGNGNEIKGYLQLGNVHWM